MMIESHDYVPFVNRTNELKLVSELLDEALNSRTTAAIIKGDVGIGKTRLTEKIIEIAREKGFEVGAGEGVKGVKIPFVALSECFSALGIEHLLHAQKPPRVDCVYLMTNKGLLIAKVERANFEIKPEIFTAMLALVNRFVQDSLKMINETTTGGIGRLEYEGWWIVIEKLGELNLVTVLSGRETEFLIEDMKNALFNIQKKYGNVLKNWNGDMDLVAGIEDEFKHIITSGKYDGIDYGKGDFAAQRTNLFENVLRGMRRKAAEKPLFIVLENIQWADESTISMLSYLIQNLRDTRLFVLLTARKHEIAESFAEDVVSELVDAGKLVEIELEEMDKENAIRILESIAPGIGASEEAIEAILQEARGNPLFLIEITKYMMQEHELWREDDRWLISKREEHTLPRKIEDIFKKKIAMMDEHMREILECASAIGDVFDPQILSQIFGMDRFDLLRKLRNIEEKYGIIHFSGENCVFEHTIAREVIYHSIPKPMRNVYHERIAEAMEKVYKDKPDGNINRIGYHYHMAGNAGKALPYLLKAIKNAEARFANAEALQYIDYAIELCEKDPELKEIYISLLENKGDLYQITGKYRDAINTYHTLLKFVQTPERIYRKMAECAHARGEYDEGITYIKKALEQIEKSNKEYGRIKLLEGTLYYRKGEVEEAQAIYLEVLSVFEEFGAEERDRALLLNNLGNVYFEKRELKKALDYYRMSLAIREKINDYLSISGSYNNIGIVYRYMHEYSTALAYFQKSLNQSEKCGHIWGMIFPLDNMGELYFAIGELEKSVQTYKTEIGYLKKIENIYALVNTYGKLAKGYAKHGLFDSAMECLVESGSYIIKRDVPLYLASHFLSHVSVYREQEKYERAIEFIEKALLEIKKIKEDQRGKILLLNALSDRADILYLMGKTQEAERICRGVLERFTDAEIAKWAGYIHITYGRLRWESGEINEARGYFRRGVEALCFYGGEYRTACAYMAWGALEKKNGNREEANRLLSQALKMFSMMKIQKKVDEVKKLFD